MRPLTGDEIAHLRRELWRCDLIGLADEPAAPADAYDCLIPLLWEAASSSEPSGQQVTELEEHVKDHFSLNPVAGQAAAVVQRTQAWIRAASG